MKAEVCKFCTKKSKAVSELRAEELEILGDSCAQVNFKKGNRIMIQNVLSHNIAYIQEGLVKIHISGPEREQILKIAKGPCYLGIPTTVGDRINHYSATALVETKVCFIGIDTFKAFLNGNPKFSYEIIVDLCKNELYNFRRCVNQLQKQSPGKIAEALLHFANNIFEDLSFELPLTRNELGDLTCTSRETVSRILGDFHKNGILEIDKNHIKLKNLEMLEHISRNG